MRSDFPIASMIVGLALSASGSARIPKDSTPHSVSFVAVEPDVVDEVLDWGGSGPTIALLAGLGFTPRVFDSFASRFIDRYHVVGITRRGFGASSRPEDGYDTARLAQDILVVLDRLNIREVILIGHSIAGDEMTAFARAYPERVRALVYLDAAYDRTRRPPAEEPSRQPSDDDVVSAERFGAYLKRRDGITMPEAELRAFAVFDASGRLLRNSTPADISAKVLQDVKRPEYSSVRAPGLAIYQPNDLQSLYHDYPTLDERNKTLAKASAAAIRAWADESIAQFRTEMKRGQVVVLSSGGHFVFLTNESEVVRLIRDFLSASGM